MGVKKGEKRTWDVFKNNPKKKVMTNAISFKISDKLAERLEKIRELKNIKNREIFEKGMEVLEKEI